MTKACAAATPPPASAGSLSQFSRYDALGLAKLVSARQVTPKELFEDAIRLHDYVAYTSLHNICGTPAMAVPLHWDSNGMPLGSQFAARTGAGATLLALAYELEEARPWATTNPPTFVT